MNESHTRSAAAPARHLNSGLGTGLALGRLLALAVSYSGVLLVFGNEANLTWADTLKGAALVFGSAVSLRSISFAAAPKCSAWAPRA